MTSSLPEDDITIKTFLRPDFYEFFPLFSMQELSTRLATMPFHQATLLGLRNIISALSTVEGKEASRAFFESNLEKQRFMLKEVMQLVGISNKQVEVIGSVRRELF